MYLVRGKDIMADSRPVNLSLSALIPTLEILQQPNSTGSSNVDNFKQGLTEVIASHALEKSSSIEDGQLNQSKTEASRKKDKILEFNPKNFSQINIYRKAIYFDIEKQNIENIHFIDFKI